MGHTALILGDQLSHDNPALEGADRVLLVEARASLARLPHHRQRRHLVLSAMRHRLGGPPRPRRDGPDRVRRGRPAIWPATHAEAVRTLEDFVTHRLAGFGPWQDAMVGGQRWLFHSRLSSSLNLWLLDPLDACRAAEAAYRAGRVPLQSAEGFIRQLIGWREYVWGMYWLREPAWWSENAMGADRPLPEGFWTGETDAECLRQTLADVRESGYANHIQRLMVLGNLMLTLGVRPWEAVEWFHAAFVDGADWVMAPNVAGMATFADGGTMMTKPYASGGNYIAKMSTYCGDCAYQPRDCPVTALYWDFMARHADDFDGNRRMRMPLASLRKLDPERLAALRAQAAAWGDALRAPDA